MTATVRTRFRGLRRRLRQAVRRPDGPPILVYQMGKVGSSTVYRSLRALDLRREVAHVHMLNDLDAIEAAVRVSYADPRGTLAQIERGRALRRRVLEAQGAPWSVITLVRDPVQRNVSAFFENLTELIPDAFERDRAGDLSVAELRDTFLERYRHTAPLAWFRTQMEPVFGIDVFATPFPVDVGHATYGSPRASLLLLRLEDLHACGEDAIRAFLDLDRFTLVRANTGSNKRYAALYDAFQREIMLPDAYLDPMYESEYARHFYTEGERTELRRRWAGHAP